VLVPEIEFSKNNTSGKSDSDDAILPIKAHYTTYASVSDLSSFARALTSGISMAPLADVATRNLSNLFATEAYFLGNDALRSTALHFSW